MAKKTTKPPVRPDSDPVDETRRAIHDLLAYIPIATYFVYWDRKQKIRRFFQVTALWILSVSLLRLVAEAAAEFGGPTVGAALTKLLALERPYQVAVSCVFAAAVTYLLFHQFAERKHAVSEYVLAEKVWAFMERRAVEGSTTEVVEHALHDFVDVFARFGIMHVSVFREHGGTLTIRKDEVFPREEDESYYVSLPVKEGVAGRVFDDLRPRYVPRLRFPVVPISFPHATIFEVSQNNGELEMTNPRIDVNAFQHPGADPQFKSFLSVPLRCLPRHAGDLGCVGVLNFDFDRTDPLDRSDIKAAVFLGRLLGEELVRLQRAPATSTP